MAWPIQPFWLFCLHWAAATLKGLIQFQNIKKSRPLFTITFKPKMVMVYLLSKILDFYYFMYVLLRLYEITFIQQFENWISCKNVDAKNHFINAHTKRAQQWKEKLCFEIRPNLCRLATFLVLKIHIKITHVGVPRIWLQRPT